MADKKFWDDMPLTALNDDLKLMVGDPNDSTNPKSITVGMLKAGLATLSFLNTNFFDKTQCYSQSQIDNLIQQINKLKFNVVDTLPESGEEGSIYLLKKADTTVAEYEQYFWVGDEKSFTKIGYKITDEEFEKMLSNSKTIEQIKTDSTFNIIPLKNLFDKNTMINAVDEKTAKTTLIRVESNKSYVISNEALKTTYIDVDFYDNDKKLITSTKNYNQKPFITPYDCYYISITLYDNTIDNNSKINFGDGSKVQIEQNDVATEIEPYVIKIQNNKKDIASTLLYKAIIDYVGDTDNSVVNIKWVKDHFNSALEYTCRELQGIKDGKNMEFKSDNRYILGTSRVYVNGVRFFAGKNYTETDDATITLSSYIPKDVDELIIEAIFN